MRKFIFEIKKEDDVQEYLDTNPHPCYRLVSVSIFGVTQYFAGITWELKEGIK
jgi:hypothetical protein